MSRFKRSLPHNGLYAIAEADWHNFAFQIPGGALQQKREAFELPHFQAVFYLFYNPERRIGAGRAAGLAEDINLFFGSVL